MEESNDVALYQMTLRKRRIKKRIPTTMQKREQIWAMKNK
jgi:hypothetical protein